MSRINPDEGCLFFGDAPKGVLFKWSCADTAVWNEIRIDLKRSFPHWTGLRYLPEQRAWFVPHHAAKHLYRWADAWFRDDARGTIGWEDDTRFGRKRPHNAPGVDDLDAAYAALHLRPTAPPELVVSAYRTLTRLNHPDIGGEHRAMVQLNSAMDTLRSCGKAAS